MLLEVPCRSWSYWEKVEILYSHSVLRLSCRAVLGDLPSLVLQENEASLIQNGAHPLSFQKRKIWLEREQNRADLRIYFVVLCAHMLAHLAFHTLKEKVL